MNGDRCCEVQCPKAVQCSDPLWDLWSFDVCVVYLNVKGNVVNVAAGLSPFDDSRCISRKMNVAATKKAAKKCTTTQPPARLNKSLPGFFIFTFILRRWVDILFSQGPFLKCACHFELQL